MRYRDFCKMSRAAQHAHARARRVTEQLLSERRRMWRRLMRKVWWEQQIGWLRSKRRDALILLGIFLGDLVLMRAIVHFIVNWR